MSEAKYGPGYAERVRRLADAVALRPAERVPTVFYTMFWYARYGGFSCREAMYDYAKVSDAVRRILLEFEPDAYAPPHVITSIGPIMDRIGEAAHPLRVPRSVFRFAHGAADAARITRGEGGSA